ncbi:MAG: hypothetical protein JSS86_20525, partial [Cyanobacteria bacterium SZAS LIN-2]|nr:hypothetical protein [Cyanobacteria bacterium SZAS LIN-2]
ATTNDSGMVAKLGGDWWTKATTADKALAGVPGQSNFTRLTDQWQPLYMTTLDRATLEKDPPPGISTDGSVVAGNPRPATDNHNATSSEPLKLIDIFPSSDNDWNQMIAKAPKDSIIVALHSSDSSWDNDMPFTGVTPELYNHIVASSNAGLKPLGYIGALEGNKPIETVKAEIDSWYQATDGHIAGIYFGNAGVGGLGRYATDAQHQAYFKEVADYIHSKGGFAAINAGGTPTDEVVRDFDMVGTYENYASQYEQSGSSANGYSNVSADHFAAELVGVSEQDIAKYGQMARDNHVGYLALTQDFNKSATDNDAYFSKVLDLVHGF